MEKNFTLICFAPLTRLNNVPCNLPNISSAFRYTDVREQGLSYIEKGGGGRGGEEEEELLLISVF